METNSSQSAGNAVAHCDVLIIGGGPAGSTAAALLAQRGKQVVLLEKAHHPRFHIGESLLPLNMPLFDKLGITQQISAIGMPKYGAQFVSPDHNKEVSVEFADAMDKSFPYSYQVRRSVFDHVLIKNAAAKGAHVFEGHRVTHVELNGADGARVTAQDEQGQTQQWHARYLVDASGRDTFLANKFDLKKKNSKHNSAALFGHFEGATRLPGKAEGNITIFWFDHGWFWFIPLQDGTTSVGAVCWPYYLKSRKTSPTQFLLDTIALCPGVAERLEHATLVGEATATGNYSYQSKRMVGEGYLLLGDAYAFIDPVFSTGVFLAMNSAFLGAETIATCLDQPQRSAQAMRQFDTTIRNALKTFSWFIYRVTTPTLRDLFMAPRNVFRVQEAMLSLLAGDVFRDTPIRSRLSFFKGIYYLNNLMHLKRSFAAWRRRKLMIRDPRSEIAAG